MICPWATVERLKENYLQNEAILQLPRPSCLLAFDTDAQEKQYWVRSPPCLRTEIVPAVRMVDQGTGTQGRTTRRMKWWKRQRRSMGAWRRGTGEWWRGLGNGVLAAEGVKQRDQKEGRMEMCVTSLFLAATFYLTQKISTCVSTFCLCLSIWSNTWLDFRSETR